MKTLSVKICTTSLLDFFANNKALAGSVSKWVATNTVATVDKNNISVALPAFKMADVVTPGLQ